MLKPDAQEIKRITDRWNTRAVGQHTRSTSAEPGTAEYFDETRRYRYEYEAPFIPRLCRFSTMAGLRVLEIGPGTGIDGVEMAANGAKYSAVEITDHHRFLTARHFELRGLEIERIYDRDLVELDIEGPPFDVVYSFGVLHHVSHEPAILRKVRHLMAPNGLLIVGVYAKYSAFNAYVVLSWIAQARMRVPLEAWRCHKSDAVPLSEPIPACMRSRRQVATLLREAGFQVETYYRRGLTPGWVPLLGRFLSPDGSTLNGLGSLIGLYHVFLARPSCMPSSM